VALELSPIEPLGAGPKPLSGRRNHIPKSRHILETVQGSNVELTTNNGFGHVGTHRKSLPRLLLGPFAGNAEVRVVALSVRHEAQRSHRLGNGAACRYRFDGRRGDCSARGLVTQESARPARLGEGSLPTVQARPGSHDPKNNTACKNSFH